MSNCRYGFLYFNSNQHPVNGAATDDVDDIDPKLRAAILKSRKLDYLLQRKFREEKAVKRERLQLHQRSAQTSCNVYMSLVLGGKQAHRATCLWSCGFYWSLAPNQNSRPPDWSLYCLYCSKVLLMSNRQWRDLNTGPLQLVTALVVKAIFLCSSEITLQLE